MENYFTLSQVAMLVGVDRQTVANHLLRGWLPQPALYAGGQAMFNKEQADAIRQHFKKSLAEIRTENNLITIEQAAAKLGIGHATLTRKIRRGEVSPPTSTVSRRSYYSAADLDKLKAELRQLAERQASEQEGFYSIKRAAVYLGVPRVTLNFWLQNGKLPRPTHDVGGQHLKYSKADLDRIKRRISFGTMNRLK